MKRRLLSHCRAVAPVILLLLAGTTFAGAAGAGTTFTDVTVEKPFSFSEPSCVENELVVLTGTMRHRFRFTVDDSGGLHIDDFFTLQGRGSGFNAITDPGLLTPVASYTASDEQLQSTNIPEPTFEMNTVFNTKVIRLGETAADDDLYLRTRAHITVNGNGVFTVDRFEESMECR